MKIKSLIAGAILTTMTVVASQPAAAYGITTTGRTGASPRLAADMLRDIARLSKATDGCAFIFSVHMRILPNRLVRTAADATTARFGGHFEEWSLNACGARQRFQVAMWPSPRGGSDYAITPLTGRMPLYVR